MKLLQSWNDRRQRGEFRDRSKENQFCKTSFLQKNQLYEMGRQVEEITRSLKMMDIEPLQIQNPLRWGEKQNMILRLVMFGAFYPNYFTKRSSQEIEEIAHKTLIGKDPTKCVYWQGMDEQQAKYGQLYLGQIKKLLEDCTKEEDRISLTFEGRKIFVEFDRDVNEESRAGKMIGSIGHAGTKFENKTGDVAQQVYVAVKMRSSQGKGRMKMNLYSMATADSKYREWQEAIRSSKESAALTTACIEQVSPPNMEVEKLVFNYRSVCYVSSPDMFFIHKDKEAVEQADRLRQVIKQSLAGLRAVRDKDVKSGNLYLAHYRSDSPIAEFYRAKVHRILPNGNVVALFIDYGNMENVAVGDMRMISSKMMTDFPEIVNTPGLALECRLAGIYPSRVKNDKGIWMAGATKLFEDYLYRDYERIEGIIFSVTKSGSKASQFVVNFDTLEVVDENEERISLKSLLLGENTAGEKFAETSPESFLSHEDHKERMRYQAVHMQMKKYLNSRYESRKKSSVEPREEERDKQQIRLELQGPFSPLEHKVLCAYRQV